MKSFAGLRCIPILPPHVSNMHVKPVSSLTC